MAKIVSLTALTLILLVSLFSSIVPTLTGATPTMARWFMVNMPTEGKAGNWVLADGSDIQLLTMAIDGTLYCYVSPSGTSYTLFKSTDNGHSWSYTGEVTDNIVDIATAPDDASVIYYATPSAVYKSTDAGSSFSPVADTPPAFADNESITCLDVSYDASSKPCVFIGSADTDDGDFGNVYYLEADAEAGWTDLEVGSYDIYAVACAPKFKDDSHIIAVVTDETHTYITNNYGVVGEWTDKVELKGASENSFAITAASNICFPSDFDPECELFIGVVCGDGGVYRVNPTHSERLDVNADIISLDLVGGASNTQLLAGENSTAEVWYSSDGGINWAKSSKPPTGESKTYVLMAPDFSSSGRAYAVTCGTESGFSHTTDGGITWNQLSLINTKIDDIVDLALSPNYSQDNTLFMLTQKAGGEHSLWRSLSGGARWERVFTSALANADYIEKVKLSPNYNRSQVVFIAGSNGNPVIWKSIDNGQGFDQPKLSPFPIDIWVVANDNTLFIGSFDAINHLGLVYCTTDSGSSYSTPAVVGSYQLHSIALSPNYDEDETILVGNTNGWVYWSNDNGALFEQLGQQLPELIANSDSNSITVAGDTEYSHNKTVYATSHCKKDVNNSSAIYRFIIGTSASWENIDSSLPTDGMIGQLVLSADGTLYAINSQPVDTAEKKGGMERCLNPTYPLGPTFETVTGGLGDGAKLTGLWLRDHRLWSIDTTNTKLMAYTDSLTQPVTLTSPPNFAPGIGTVTGSTIRHANLIWEPLSGATSYSWQLDYNADFSTAPIPFKGDTEVNSTSLAALEPATTYYWRVRVTEPLLSPWSAKYLFTTSLGTTTTAPSLKSPGSGAKQAELKPVFQWSAIAGADAYELLVSTDVSFASPIIKKTGAYALPTTAWKSDVNLAYDTTYYWKVKAISVTSCSAWSAVSAFTTRSSPASASAPSTPSPSRSTAPNLVSPGAAASGVGLKPIFQWSVIAEADSYELLVATDVSFASPIIIKIGDYALPANAWQCDINLDYDTTYYWKVRATGSSSYHAWSAVSAFTTESPPTPTLAPQPSESPPAPEISPPEPPAPEASSLPETPPPPSPLSQPTTPEWVNWLMYLGGALFLTMVAVLITLIILSVRVGRL